MAYIVLHALRSQLWHPTPTGPAREQSPGPSPRGGPVGSVHRVRHPVQRCIWHRERQLLPQPGMPIVPPVRSWVHKGLTCWPALEGEPGGGAGTSVGLRHERRHRLASSRIVAFAAIVRHYERPLHVLPTVARWAATGPAGTTSSSRAPRSRQLVAHAGMSLFVTNQPRASLGSPFIQGPAHVF